jgi:hypothetical protein
VFNSFGWSTLFGIYAVAFVLAASTWTVIDPWRVFYEEEPQRAN